MYGHGYPYAPPPPPPPPPRPPGLSPLAIALIAIGGVAVLGGGACVVVGGLLWFGGQSAGSIGPSDDRPVASAQSSPAGTGTGASTSAGAGAQPPSLAPLQESDDQGSALASADDDDDHGGHDNARVAATSTTSSSGSAPPSTAKTTGGTKWFCNATGLVRVCGFANVCNNQMVSGIGSGSDRFIASTMAKNACENMARAKGGSTVCSVSCSLR